jgi:hypothetical protein
MSPKKKKSDKFVPFAGIPKKYRPNKEQTRAELDHLKELTPGTMTGLATQDPNRKKKGT